MIKVINRGIFIISLHLLGLLAFNSTYAATYKLNGGNVVGSIYQVRARSGETLLQIAQKYDIGVNEMLAYNRGKRLHQPLRGGTPVVVPARFVLPAGRQGIVINLAQKRLYYFHNGSVSTYPIGVGKQGWGTRRGATRIVGKTTNPTWRPPASIRREAARRGKTLPLAIGPGPRNPLGRHAMYLGFKGFLIHSTIAPSSIGTNSSHGCIRMYPHNIQQLFGKVAVGTSVFIH